MGTRAAIARRTGESTFTGRYHHWDGYPEALGASLFKARQHFGNTDAMLKYLIDDHPAGWSTINDADFTKPAGYEEDGFRTSGPHCYCHGGLSESEQIVTESNASDCGCVYAYVFDGNTMLVLASVWKKDGHKMIGLFGCGGEAKDIAWKTLATVDLTGKEPNWEAMTLD